MPVILMTPFIMGVFSCKNDSPEPNPDTNEPDGSSCVNGIVYVEQDGLVKGEFESVVSKSGWQLKSDISGFEGEGYLVWTGQDYFNTPGSAKLTYPIKITNPGTYRFIWRSRIAEGTSNTDFNDSWLRFPTADDFYGEKADGSIVYPKGSGNTPVPEGSGSDGWFKVYMNSLNTWFWGSSTSDNDPHSIYVKFENPGVYEMEVSARSMNHALDKFVLFISDQATATNANTPLSKINCKEQ